MQKSDPRGAKAGFGLQDVLYVLFKHKWKILISSAIGLAAAASLYVTRKPFYESQAELVINSVLQRGALDGHETEMAAGGRGGEQVVNTEMLILRSGDLAAEVAEAIGVDRLVPDAPETASINDAAMVVQLGLEVMPASKGSNVINVIYRNVDPELTVDVLREVVKRYYAKHLEIHRSTNAFDSVESQVKEVRERLSKTEADLNKIKSGSGIISLNNESLSLSAQRDRTKQDLNSAKAELAEQSTLVERLERRIAETAAANSDGVTPIGSQVIAKKPEVPVVAAPTAAQIEAYEALAARLKFHQQRDFDLQSKYASGDIQVVRNRQDMERVRADKAAMLDKIPGLAGQIAAAPGAPAANPVAELEVEKTKLKGLEAKIASYEADLHNQNTRITELAVLEPQIAELERRREMEDAEYRMLETNLKKARVDRTLDPAQMGEIRVVDQPSVPVRTYSDLMKKIILGLAGAGVGVGVGLAFLIELVIDRRIKRPTEIESRLQLPLMLSIPFVRPKNRGALLIGNDRPAEAAGEGDRAALPAVRGSNGFHAFPPKTDHFIHPYSEAIRDRIVFNFQVNNMTHKPKLMAVTGLSAGAGASTIAAGLAKAFSEVNGAKVLLVDLTSEYPDDNPMFGNKPLHSLVGALQAARNTRFKEGSQNLYLASAASRKTDPNATAFGPMHLYELLPHFRASEFDYIIFDMPALAQTSPTLAMAGLMDKVLLVVDGEDTNRETLKWGYSELVKGRADVSCIYNKARAHAPSWVLGEV
jgi:succinoglycan biosynthesis transport protein ExoP